MFVERYGGGARAFVGLHGWGNDRRVFAPLAAHVPQDVSFHAADLPGCGSSALPRGWSVDEIVTEIVETIRSLDSGSVTLVGHCGGAVFGLLAAREAEHLIERVVAVDPFAYLPRYFRLFTGEGFGRRAYGATFANPLGRRLTDWALNAGRESRADLTASFGATNHEVARRYLALFASIAGVEVFRGLCAEVDLVYGERTFGAVRKSVATFIEVMPHARALQLAGARHTPLAEAPAQLARIVFGREESKAEDSEVLTDERAEEKLVGA